MEAQVTPNLRLWRWLQAIVFGVGVMIVASLVFAPKLGLHLLWDVLIPAAPLLFVFVPGFWRNVCPVSTSAMLPQRLGHSRKREIPTQVVPWLALAGVLLLYAVVPLRHALFDLNATASAFFLLAAAGLAYLLGHTFAWKSAWCAGLCPVRPVEALYGFRSATNFANAHCGSCANCTAPCPDSTPEALLHVQKEAPLQRFTNTLMVGGFVGFIWGWFHVADYTGMAGWSNLGTIYLWPIAAAVASCALYLFILRATPFSSHTTVRRIFACAAVSCYYWYRLPMLMGFGLFPGDGMLVDLRHTIPAWLPVILPYCTTALFAWWMVLSPRRGHAWLARPSMLPLAERIRV